MSDFSIVVPEFSQNLISHPSVELADVTGWTLHNLATFVRSAVQSRWGLYSLAITPGGGPNVTGVFYTVASAINTPHTFSVWVYGVLGDAYTLRMIDGAVATLGTTNFVGTGAWQLVEVSGSTAGNATVNCYLTKDIAGGGVFYADGWQLETLAYRTTFISGERPGCEWMGTPHASISQRSAQARMGGRVRDLETDYALDISGIMGTGAPPQTVHVDEFAISPGGQYGSTKIHPRVWVIMGAIHGTSHADYHLKRQGLGVLFDIKAHPESQPVTLRYTGAAVEKEIDVYYEGGLEGTLRAADPACHREKVALRVVSDDPFWREVGQHSAELDVADDMIFRTVAVREKSTGQWDPMGPPNVVGGYHTVLAMARDAGGRVYLAGNFTNWDNNVNGAHIVMWDPVAGTYTPLGVGLDDTVRAIAIHPDGQVYLAGNFTDIRTNPGGGTYNRIVRWDPVALTYNALGVGTDDDIYTLAIGHNNVLYCGGAFHNAGGAGAWHVAQYTVAAGWSQVGVGLNAEVFASDVGGDGGIFFAGNFNDLIGGPGQTYSRLAKWNPVTSTWTTLTSGRVINGHVNAIEVYKDDTVYFGGDFPTVDAQTFNDIGVWNGTSLIPLMLGLDDEVHALETDPTGLLHVGGRFNNAVGDIELPQLAQWNGSRWLHADIRLPVIEAVFSILVGAVDPIIDANFDLFIGGATPVGGETIAGVINAINAGTAPARPRIAFHRDGGGKGSAGGRARIRGVRNETTGKIILYSYGLLTGETLMADTTSANQSVRSSWPAAQGRAGQAVLGRCDFGTFDLIPGTNVVTTFVTVEHAEFNDQGNQLSDWENISGVTPAVTDAADNLYISVIDDGGGFWHVEIFDNVARGAGDLVGHTASYNGVGVQGIAPDGGSGLGGVITIDALGPADVDIYVNFTRPTAWMIWTDAYKSYD